MKNTEIELLEIYKRAKKAYYIGEPILSDVEFDELETKLEKLNALDKFVGFDDDDRNAKFNHPSKMLSLSKIQAGLTEEDELPLESANKWFNKVNEDFYEATPKFDGNALNVVYKKGKLDCILSRGSGTAGRDYTDKLINNVPLEINTSFDIVEVRGEVVISTKIFDDKYYEYKNERNFVAGVLNRDEDVTDITNDFEFVAVEAKGHNGSSITYIETVELENDFGFNKSHKLMIYIFSKSEFKNAYKTMKHYRQQVCPYRLDGFVIKTSTDTRSYYGENSHDPNWAVAIKFPPEGAATTIIDIKWSYGKTGQLTPVAILAPIELDGTTVQRASVHNFGWMIANGCVPGAKVLVMKKGDIIPQIVEILK